MKIKRLLAAILCFTAFSSILYSQVPGFNYQAVVRDNQGALIINQEVEVSLAILRGSAEGEAVFTETHQVQTNDFGLINLQIGSVNSLDAIEWGSDSYFLRIILDGIVMGTTQLLSVPFALHAISSADAFSGDYNDLANIPSLDGFIEISNAQDGDMIFFDGNQWVTIPLGTEGQVLTVVDGLPQWADIPEVVEPGTVTDIDGNVYPTVIIGNQEWMAENLRTTRYNDGSLIPTNLSNSVWENTTEGAWTVYPHSMVPGIDSDEQMIAAYGRWYNWYTTVDPRGLCPAGWRVPTGFDFIELTDFITGQNPDNIGNQLKSCRQINSPLGEDCNVTDHPRWNSNNTHFGTDDFGFAGLPTSARRPDGGFIPLFGHMVTYWSSSEYTGPYVFTWGLYVTNGDVYVYNMFLKNYGFSVRCVKE